MVILHARPVLVVATIVWVLWRAMLWRRRTSTDGAREAVVAALFSWSLVIVWATLFPLTIIFYDWHGASNLIPFASIIQLIRETPPEFAFENIAGNLALFVPLGVLLPVLFNRLKAPLPLLWRAATISLLIEGTQYLTRARSLDIDDVVLNTTGAIIGLGIYQLAAAAIAKVTARQRTLQRLGSATTREPLLTGALPMLVTVAIAVPMMISTVVGQTLSGDSNGIDQVALSDLPTGAVVARTDIADHTFLVVASETATGTQLSQSQFKRVLPGRYTWLGTSDTVPAGDGSSYRYSITAFNPTAGESPIVAVWGTKPDHSTSVRIAGNGIDTVLPLEPGPQFIVGTPFGYDDTVGILNDFQFTFMDNDGAIVPAFHVGQ